MFIFSPLDSRTENPTTTKPRETNIQEGKSYTATGLAIVNHEISNYHMGEKEMQTKKSKAGLVCLVLK